MTIRTSGRSLVHRLNTLTEFYEYEKPIKITMHFWDETMVFRKWGDRIEDIETIRHKLDPAEIPDAKVTLE